jgi:glucose dehydrogenase
MQTSRKSKNDTMNFYPKVHLVATKLVPVVSTTHLVVWQLIGIHKASPHVERHKNLPTSEGSSMTRSTMLLFMATTGWAWYPS